MVKNGEKPSIERLREAFTYDPKTGELRKSANGQLAGTPDRRGYRQIMIDGWRCRAHQVVYAMHHGEWAPDAVDHINRVPSDNRIENLRAATFLQNSGNRKNIGFEKSRGKHRVAILHDGERIHLGAYAKEEDAAAMASFAAVYYRGNFAPDEAKSAVAEILSKANLSHDV